MGKAPALKIICLAATKGGVGKTTLTAALAIRAAQDKKRVALIDVDPQNSLGFWRSLREGDGPELFDVDCSAEGIALIAAEGFQYVFVDTPPALMDHIAEAIHISDFVLIPVRASAIDLDAVQAMVELCQDQEKPFAFVLNQAEIGWRVTETAAEVLSDYGPVIDAPVAYRRPYILAMNTGQSGPEVERGTACSDEIDALWDAVKKAAARATRARV